MGVQEGWDIVVVAVGRAAKEASGNRGRSARGQRGKGEPSAYDVDMNSLNKQGLFRFEHEIESNERPN